MSDENKIKDRLLGDEWEGWSGEILESEKEINEKPWLFIFFYFISIIIYNIVALLIYYFISPRIKTINLYLDTGILIIIILILFIINLKFFLVLLSVLFKKNLLLKNPRFELFLSWIYKLTDIFKISKDRIGNSYIKLNNSLLYFKKVKKSFKNLLILLPRCLKKDIKDKVMEIVNKYNCKVFIATGGSSARQIVIKEKPDAIIGVACERDLVAGIKDTSNKIFVIGIANKRPEGPCKNTEIDLNEFENAIKYFLNIK